MNVLIPDVSCYLSFARKEVEMNSVLLNAQELVILIITRDYFTVHHV